MNKYAIIAGIVFLVFAIAMTGLSIAQQNATDSTSTVTTGKVSCSSCGGKCTAQSNCGLATCGAANGGTCGCGKTS